LVKSGRLNFSSGSEVPSQKRYLPTDRLTTSSAQIIASLVFDLSYFYAIVADFHTRDQHLFSKPGYLALIRSHLKQSGSSAAPKQSIGERASERVEQSESSPFVRMKSDPLAKSMNRLERVKGIEPSYSAWKS